MVRDAVRLRIWGGGRLFSVRIIYARWEIAYPGVPVRPFADASSRFGASLATLGWPREETLWTDAIDQAEMGRLGPPRRLTASPGPYSWWADQVSAARRFALIRMGEIRARGDLKCGCVDLGRDTRALISLRSWGKVGQIWLGILATDQPLSFFKADRMG